MATTLDWGIFDCDTYRYETRDAERGVSVAGEANQNVKRMRDNADQPLRRS